MISEVLAEFGRLELHMSRFHDWSRTGSRIAGAQHFEEMADLMARGKPLGVAAPVAAASGQGLPRRRRRRRRGRCRGRQEEDVNLQRLRRACGTTASAFANLFLSRAQIRDGQSFDVVSGGLFTRIYRVPNFSWTALFADRPRANHYFLQRVEDYHRGRSTAAVSLLCNELLQAENESQLPRVFFVNLSWILRSSSSSSSSSSIMDKLEENGHDHEFIIIKRARRHHSRAVRDESEPLRISFEHEYQLLQGYQPTAAVAGLAGAAPVPTGQVGREDERQRHELNGLEDGVGFDDDEPGYHLWEWQASGHRWSSHDGFGASELQRLMTRLGEFTTNERWDCASHGEMFGMACPGLRGRRYWPAFSFQELADDTIAGIGERPLSECLSGELERLEVALGVGHHS